MAHYFAADGNYGSAYDAVVVDTGEWTETDWEMIESSGDTGRMAAVGQIIEMRKSNWSNVGEG